MNSFSLAVGYAASGPPSGGNVGTNGNVTLNGGKTVIYSTAALDSTTTGACNNDSFNGLTTSGGAQVTGGLVQLNGPIAYPAPPAPNPVPPTTTQNIAGSCPSGMSGCTNAGAKTVSLTPGTYVSVRRFPLDGWDHP